MRSYYFLVLHITEKRPVVGSITEWLNIADDEEESEPEVEDKSPNSHTTGEEEIPPAINVDNGEPPNPSEDVC